MSTFYTTAELYPDPSADTSVPGTNNSHPVVIAIAITISFILVAFLLSVAWALHVPRMKKTRDVEKAKEGVSVVEIEGWRARGSEDTQGDAESVSSIVKE